MFIGIYNKTVILTFIGLIFSIIGISSCFYSNTDIAIIFLMLAGICDAFDGVVASKVNRDKTEIKYGIQLDSLVDIISSGIFPIIILMSMGFCKWYNTIIYCLFAISGVIRLAYFNICCEEDKEYFKGVPITTSTMVIPFIYIFTKNEIFLSGAMLLLSILFLINIIIKKLNFMQRIILTIIGVTLIAFFIIRGLI